MNTDRIKLFAAAAILIITFAFFICTVGEKTSNIHTAEDGTSTDREDGITPELLAETPPDIKAMETDFLRSHDGDGDIEPIKEKFEVTNGATDICGNVAIKNATEGLFPDFEALIKKGTKADTEDKTKPTVLVYHTHTSESYMLTDNGSFYKSLKTHDAKSDRNMLRIGEELCTVLEKRGIGYIHDTNTYDESYNGAYARSRVTVQQYLKQYPSIKIVLDVHRDAVSENGMHLKPTAVINGKKTAQVMILTGAEDGDITDFPNWESNLRFALTVQKLAQEKYTGLMKPIFFCPRKYNMDVAECAVLLEIGTQANTLEEAVYAARLIGDVIADTVVEAKT